MTWEGQNYLVFNTVINISKELIIGAYYSSAVKEV